MSLEMRMVPQHEMGFFYITHEELSKAVEEYSPFRQQLPTRTDITRYLTNVNGSLIASRSSPERIGPEYVTASSIYTFVCPLVHLNLPQELSTSFKSIVRRSPYRVENPFTVIFKPAMHREEEDEMIEHQEQHSLINMEDIDLDPSAVFTRSERCKRAMVASTRIIVGNLLHEYTREGHFSFVGLYDVCFPLFGVRLNKTLYNDLGNRLRNQYGSFSIQFPKCIKETISSHIAEN